MGNSAPPKVLVWLDVIANGGMFVEEQNSCRTRQYVPAIEAVAAQLHFKEIFRGKHARRIRVFTSLLQDGSGKQWKSDSTPEKDAF